MWIGIGLLFFLVWECFDTGGLCVLICIGMGIKGYIERDEVKLWCNFFVCFFFLSFFFLLKGIEIYRRWGKRGRGKRDGQLEDEERGGGNGMVWNGTEYLCLCIFL